jgi:hypothetical protein
VDSVWPTSEKSDSGAWPLLHAQFGYELDCEATLAAFAIEPETDGALTCQGQTVVFSPTQPLDPGTAYAAKIENVYLKDDPWPRQGVRWELATAHPLVVLYATPVDGSSLTDLWTPIELLFNRPVLAESAQDRFAFANAEGQALPGEVTWEEEGARLVFRPEAPLRPAEEYRFSLDAGTEDHLGFKIDSPLARSFGTEPLLVEVTPANGAFNLPLNEVVRVTFGRAMDQASVEAGLAFSPTLEGSYIWEESSLAFAPVGGWAPDTEYQATIMADVLDASGAPLGESFDWSFSTRPLLVKAEPAPGKVLTKLGTPVEYAFALPMDRDSVEAALEVTPPVEGTVTWAADGRSFAFRPEPAWQPATSYEVTLSG